VDVSIFLAKVLGLYLVIIGVAFLFKMEWIKKGALVALKDPGLGLLTAIITLIIGILLVVSHNIWRADWTVVITLIAWITFIKGIIRIYNPTFFTKWVESDSFQKVMVTSVIFTLATGLFLIYFGFFH